jgi:hypothetical protein
MNHIPTDRSSFYWKGWLPEEIQNDIISWTKSLSEESKKLLEYLLDDVYDRGYYKGVSDEIKDSIEKDDKS